MIKECFLLSLFIYFEGAPNAMKLSYIGKRDFAVIKVNEVVWVT